MLKDRPDIRPKAGAAREPDLFDLVIDTTRRSADPATRRPKKGPGEGPGLKVWFDGHIGGRPGRASVSFSCPVCHKKYLRRNVRRLGKELYESGSSRYVLP